MRTTILAKWTVLFGVVLGLGAGSASAQIEFDGEGTQVEVDEGGRVAVKYRMRVTIAAGATETMPFATWTFSDSGIPADKVDDVGGNDLPTAAENVDGPPSGSFRVVIPGNSGGTPITRTVRGEFTFFARQDIDAEDELGWLGIMTLAGVKQADVPADDLATNSNLVLVRINDSQTPEFEWKKQSAADDDLKEGPASVTPYNLESKYPIEDEDWFVAWDIDTAGYTVTAARLFDNNTTSIPVVIQPPANDGNRVDDEVTLTAFNPGTNGPLPGAEEPVTMTFEDIHALPEPADIEWKAYTDDDGKPSTTEATSITEGGPPVHVTVTVDRGEKGYPMGEALEVTPTGDSPDYRLEGLSGGSLEIASGAGKKSATFKVYATLNDRVVAENLMLNLQVAGAESANGAETVMAAKPFMLPVDNETVPLLQPKSDEEVMAAVASARAASAGADELWRPGDMFMLDKSDLFEDSDNPFTLAARSSNDEVVAVEVRGDTLTVTAMSIGDATVTVTGTAASSVVTQTRSNLAVIEFDLTVDRAPVGITLSGPADMNIAEGNSVTLTATANDPVTANTEVQLRLTGGSASPEDFSVMPIMLAAGETTGTTELTAREDMTAEAMETLTITGRFGDGMTTNSLTFNIWDAAVPALPVIAQLLLAALLAVGAGRRLRRR